MIKASKMGASPKKIGILTFSHTKNMNFGAMLQSYALYSTLKRMGFEPYIINWKIKKRIKFSFNDIDKNTSKYFYIKAIVRRFIGVFFNSFINFIAYKIGEAPFIEFSEKYLPNKSNQVTKKNFSKLNDLFDFFVVGSDQVWRYKTCPDIYTFFLDFVDETKVKVAYAASFGIDQWNEAPEWVTKDVSRLIKRFKGISVRESKGVAICKSTFDVSATQVLDPTLLLDQNNYVQLIKEQNVFATEKSDFIAIMLLDNIDYDDFHLNLSKRTQLPTLNIKGKNLKLLGKFFMKYNSIPYWLEMIRTAQFVVTDSFHGAVFCLLFEKSFAVILNEERGRSRLESLFSLFKIDNILFSTKEEFLSSGIWLSKINYHEVNQILKKERVKSMNFLSDVLSHD